MEKKVGRPPRPLEERYMEKVDVRGPDECWNWRASLQGSGYGQITYDGSASGVKPAHRVGWMMRYGEIPEGKMVMHTCDNRLCQNPAHWRLGTNQDNMDDMKSKGRQRRGEQHWKHRLTEQQALEIRQQKGTVGAPTLAAQYGICSNTVYAIWRGQIWRGAGVQHVA